MNPKVVEAKIVREIANQIWNSRELIIDLEDQCDRLLRKHLPNISSLEICEVLEDVVRKVKSQLRSEINHCRKKGTTPRYEFSEVTNVLYRARHIRVDEIKLGIKNIKWRNFEYLCKHLLEINGIEEAEVTSGTKEGGIDFYGLLRMHKFARGVLLKDLEIRIIGQARHRSAHTKIGHPEVKLFAKQYTDFKSGKGKGREAVPDWFRNSKSPLTGMFITNTEFTKDAYDAAKEEGIILKDGDQIAEDLFRSPRVNEWLYTEGEQILKESQREAKPLFNNQFPPSP